MYFFSCPCYTHSIHDRSSTMLSDLRSVSPSPSPSLPPPPPPSLRHRTRSPGPSTSTSHVQKKERVRTKAKDYPEHQGLIVAATRPYYVQLWTCDPFPDDKLQERWAMDSWDTVSDGVPIPDFGVIRYVSNVTHKSTLSF